MVITIWELFHYLYRRRWLIILATFLCIAAAYLYVAQKQTYNAQIIIQYNDQSVKEGRALDDAPFDAYEIAQPKVITNTIAALGSSKTVDNIRSKIKVEPIIPDSIVTQKTAREEDGEAYEYYPNVYTVSYTGTLYDSASTVRDILDALVESYLVFYTEKYLNLATINDVTYQLGTGGYDYIERAELLQNNLSDTADALERYYAANPYFRSTTTGLSFGDLEKEYARIKNNLMPKLFSDILHGQITKDRDLLINKYHERMDQLLLDAHSFDERAALSEDRMNSFADANRDVPNGYNYAGNGDNDDKLPILEGIDSSRTLQEQTTYDSLMMSYVDNSVAANNDRLDIEYCKNVIDSFSEVRERSADLKSTTEVVLEQIRQIESELDELYTLTNTTVDDYNAYIATQHISVLTGVRYYETVSRPFYILIAVVLGVALSCVCIVTYELTKAYTFYRTRRGRRADDVEKGEKPME